MKIFITGSTGFIGEKFLTSLLGSGLGKSTERIYLLQRSKKKYKDACIDAILGGIENTETYADAFLNSDYVFHFAGNAALGKKNEGFDQNRLMTQALVSILLESAELKRIIFISSIMAEGRSKTEYGVSKALSEKIIIDSGLPYVIFRPCFVYGKGMRENSHLMVLKKMVERRAFPTYLKLPGKISMIHVEDLCKALLVSVNHKNKAFIATTETLALDDIFRIFSMSLHGKHLNTFKVPNLICNLINRLTCILPFKYVFPFTDFFLYDDETFQKTFFPNNKTQSFCDSDLIKKNHK